MLKITIPAREWWDEQNEVFNYDKAQNLTLEHSLVSLSKWEMKWNKPFLSSEKSDEEVIDYIRCMTITQNVDPKLYRNLTDELLEQITKYIDEPMTATWFSDKQLQGGTPNREIVTSEIIYYWMTVLNIPLECQKWHLNKLLTFIQVCNIKSQPPKKVPKQEQMDQMRELNEARKKQYNTTG